MLFTGFSHDIHACTAWTDIDGEGNFQYGAFSASWTNWANGEPNGGYSENCVFAHGSDFRWKDYPCDAECLAICTIDPAE